MAVALFCLACLATALGSSACRGTVQNQGLARVEYDESVGKAGKNVSAAQGLKQDPMQVTSAFNLQEEEAVAKGCLQAWRQGLKDKNDVKAIEMLEELSAKHPGISSVHFMMGQVEEHFGKHAQASLYYKKAYDINDFSSVQTFKLAESMRKSGDAAGSLPYYQKLLGRLESAANEHGYAGASVQLMSSVRLGLAQSLKDLKRNDEAVAEVKKVIASKPDDKTKEKAGALLKELEKE